MPKMSEITAELKSLQATRSAQWSEYDNAKAERDMMLKLKVNLQHTLGKDVTKERGRREVSR